MRRDYVPPSNSVGSEGAKGSLYFLPGVQAKGGFTREEDAWAYVHFGLDLRPGNVDNPAFLLHGPITKLAKDQGERVAYYGVRNAYSLAVVSESGKATFFPHLVTADLSVYRTLMLSDNATGRAFRDYKSAEAWATSGDVTPLPGDLSEGVELGRDLESTDSSDEELGLGGSPDAPLWQESEV
jgi:hypothetical protein